MINQEILQNDPDSIKYRKNVDNLVILGTGVILFGFWSIMKFIAYLALDIPLYDEGMFEDMDPIGTVFVMIFVAIFYVIDMIIRLIVGLGARAEGKGIRRPGKAYLFFNIWLIVFSIISVIIAANFFVASNGMTYSNLISLFMELSSLLILLEVFISALYVRKYRREHKKTEGM